MTIAIHDIRAQGKIWNNIYEKLDNKMKTTKDNMLIRQKTEKKNKETNEKYQTTTQTQERIMKNNNKLKWKHNIQ